MKKINNKGITLIEIIACISIVTVIVFVMLKSVTSYNEKRKIESIKTVITTKKNIITKTIYDDIIERNGIVDIVTSQSSSDSLTGTIYYKDNTSVSLAIYNNSIIYDNEKFTIPEDEDLKFNRIYISDNQYGIYNIHVGVYSADITDIGDKYTILDLKTPDVDSEYYENLFG